jgi:hypothetical protein
MVEIEWSSQASEDLESRSNLSLEPIFLAVAASRSRSPSRGGGWFEFSPSAC